MLAGAEGAEGRVLREGTGGSACNSRALQLPVLSTMVTNHDWLLDEI